jgi:hypothetical protein
MTFEEARKVCVPFGGAYQSLDSVRKHAFGLAYLDKIRQGDALPDNAREAIAVYLADEIIARELENQKQR